MFRYLQFLVYSALLSVCLFAHAHAQRIDYEKLPFLTRGTTYLWPTNASDYMSATFGETRSAHFHAAIDVGTWGQQGYRVFAARDGILSRVGVSPTGYGNVIYLKHDDGSYSMYAHLRNFNTEIQRLVDELRLQTYTFNFDRNLESYSIRYKRGDLIGFSGDTGIGPPHLHFELRTPSNNPFNPLLAGISVPDRVPPRISGVSIEPISSDALVNGRKSHQTVTVRGSGRNFEFGTITASGTIGLGVDASDRADAMRNVYAVYELKLTINDSLFFHSKADSFEIAKSRMMFLDRVYPILREERKGYQRLFIRDGNEVAFYKDVGHNGMINLPPGLYTVKIEAADFFGNRSIATGRLRITDPQVPTQPIPIASTSNTLTVNQSRGLPSAISRLYWTNDWFTNRTPNQSIAVTLREPGSFIQETTKVELSTSSDVVDLRNHNIMYLTLSGEDMVVHRVRPGERTILRTPDQRLSLEFRPNTLYDTMSVAFAWKIENNRYYFETTPSHEPLQVGYVMRMIVPDSILNSAGVGIYQVNRSGSRESFSYVGGTRNRGALQLITSNFGTFTILNDTTPPEMTRPRLYQRADGQWLAAIRVSDSMSGVDYTSAEVYMNGTRGIPEYDPFGSQIRFYLPGFTPRARNNEFRVILSDRVGNQTDQTFNLNRP